MDSQGRGHSCGEGLVEVVGTSHVQSIQSQTMDVERSRCEPDGIVRVVPPPANEDIHAMAC